MSARRENVVIILINELCIVIPLMTLVSGLQATQSKAGHCSIEDCWQRVQFI